MEIDDNVAASRPFRCICGAEVTTPTCGICGWWPEKDGWSPDKDDSQHEWNDLDSFDAAALTWGKS